MQDSQGCYSEKHHSQGPNHSQRFAVGERTLASVGADYWRDFRRELDRLAPLAPRIENFQRYHSARRPFASLKAKRGEAFRPLPAAISKRERVNQKSTRNPN